jgi:hypothetical protein
MLKGKEIFRKRSKQDSGMGNPVKTFHGILIVLLLSGCVAAAGAVDDYVQTAVWGGWGSGDGQFNDPGGVAVDGDGYVYVADT